MKNKIIEIMCGVFSLDKSDLPEDISKKTVENWDSLQHLILMSEIENKFSLKFEPEEIINVNSINDLEELIKKHEN
jgi:acyl carrier protein